jgi:hypothetical protein
LTWERQFSEQTAVRSTENGMHEFRRHVGEWLENESPLGVTRVRNVEMFRPHPALAEREQVQINHPRPPTDPTDAPQSALDAQKRREERVGRQRSLDAKNGIQVRALRRATHGFGFVRGRDAANFRRGKPADQPHRRRQVRRAASKI